MGGGGHVFWLIARVSPAAGAFPVSQWHMPAVSRITATALRGIFPRLPFPAPDSPFLMANYTTAPPALSTEGAVSGGGGLLTSRNRTIKKSPCLGGGTGLFVIWRRGSRSDTLQPVVGRALGQEQRHVFHDHVGGLQPEPLDGIAGDAADEVLGADQHIVH